MTTLGMLLAVLVVTTANVRVSLPADQARRDVDRAAAGGTALLLLQEMGHRRIARFTPAGFRCWQAPTGPGREVPVCWRVTRFAQIAAHTTILARSDLFPSATRAAAVVQLRDRTTGRVWPVVNVHMIPHIEKGGHLRPLPRAAVATRALSTVDAIADRLAARYGRVIVGGDFNIGATADARVRDHRLLWWRMNHGPANLDTSWNTLPPTRPTLGPRRVDYLWWLKGSARIVWARTITGLYSDHHALRIGLR